MIIAVNNVPATASTDAALRTSCISRRFLMTSKLPFVWDEGVFRGRVFMARENGPVFMDLEMAVVETLAYDAILGSDWERGIESTSLVSLEPLRPSQSVSAPAVAEYDIGESVQSSQSHSSLFNEPSGSGYGVLYANIFGQANAVNAASLSYAVPVFKANIWQLKHLMSLHGLASNHNDLSLCRLELLSHLLTGSCVTDAAQSSACRLIGSGYTRASELCLLILRDLSERRLASVWPTANLRVIAAALGMKVTKENIHLRAEIQSLLRDRMCMLQAAENRSVCPLADVFQSFERHNRATLVTLCSQHSIPVTCKSTSEEMRHLLCDHLVSGLCTVTDGTQCLALRNQWLTSSAKNEWNVFFLSSIVDSRISLKPMQRLLKVANIPFSAEESLSQLRSTLKAYIRTLSKGKCVDIEETIDLTCGEEVDADLEDIRSRWPPSISSALKDESIRMFQEQTSSQALATSSCACCAEDVLLNDLVEATTDDFDYELLKRPDYRDVDLERTPSTQWLGSVDCEPPLPLADDPALEHFRDILLDRPGILKVESSHCLRVRICRTCLKCLQSGRLPALAIANRLFLGDVPEELKHLTVVEEAMIARCRAKCWIIQLKEEYSNIELPNNQRGVRGHIVIYPQNTSEVVQLLPPSVEEITSPICVLFVGSHPPTAQWLREKARPLAVRPAVVRRALQWLKLHNPLYKDIIINEPVLRSLSETEILPFSIQHIQPSEATETQTSRYDATDVPSNLEGEVSWQNVVIANVDGEASSNALRAAAFQHVKNNKGGYIQIPHDSTPVNEFIDPKLFPMIYPTLFPYGLGGLKDKDRETPLSMQRHVKHLFNMRDRRFQEHYSFLFTAFNMLQRHSILLYTKLKTQQSNFDKLAVALADVDAATIHTVVERMSRGESVSDHWRPNEIKLFTLMREVSALCSNVPGSASARSTMRNEIRALMVDKGLPNFYITINPADVYNPIVNLLAGSEINIDELLEKDLLGYWKQSTLVANNPAVAAKFFNVYMKAFISCLLRYDPEVHKRQEGVLGFVKAYYGCVEAQGRGTLHCHMLIWLEGGLNPNELKDKILADETFRSRLVAYLEDSISSCVPEPPKDDVSVASDHHHPCSVRGVRISGDNDVPQEDVDAMRQKDMHNLVSQCQRHTHTRTCYKYFKGAPGERKECRFDLDENNVRPLTTVDHETGEILIRKLDGMVNNFNATILEAVRCNMDIQFVGSGISAKAMIYYMTDYITKSALKTHVAFAALEMAVKQMERYVPEEEDSSFRAKVLLRRCAYMMLSHQELSAQQVASYIMGYEDHFKSHNFVTLFWPSCERFIDFEDPSPECRTQRRDDNDDSEENGIVVQGPADELEFETVADDEVPPLEPNIEGISVTPAPPDEEVQVFVDSDGELVASTSFTDDYRFRGTALKTMSLWEFRARIKKVKMTKALKVVLSGLDATRTQFLNRRQLYIPLMKEHKQSDTHILRFTPFGERLVPIPTGPKIPRRDSAETLPRFCRLMLVLFKPWSSVRDLRDPGESWLSAYEKFLQNCTPDVRLKIENTQVLHECRDSRDNHFAQRRNRWRNPEMPLDSNADGRNACDSIMADAVSNEEVLEHLQQIQSCYEDKRLANQHKMVECLNYAEKYGLYDTSNIRCLSPFEDNSSRSVCVTDESMEDAWGLEYENRRDTWKKKATMTADMLPNSVSTADAAAVIDNGSSMRDSEFVTNEADIVFRLPRIERNIDSCMVDTSDVVELVSQKWSLNREQQRAFRIVAEHSMEKAPPQLRMYLGGLGGAGKSRVIKALCDFFEHRSQRRRLRLASFTGVAARNIQGVTLHASLFLNQRTSKGTRTKTLRDLIAVWDGVDYLVVDEVSMIGCPLMYDISKALSEAKSNSHPFGGVHLIFAGDFAQLPPVCETRLYARLNPRSKGGKAEQKKMLGKLLWFSVDTVVVLTEVMRQGGKENQAFVELLARLRTGRCSTDDFDLLNSRLISKTNVAGNELVLMNTPILVTKNSVKDFLNEKGAESFSRRTRRSLNWYYAIDKINGNVIEEDRLKAHLRGLSTSHTSQRLGRLPLVIGMPVMITQNFDVEHGIVNGSMGTLKSVRYMVDKCGDRHATSCVVEIPDMSGPKLVNLNSGEAAVIRDTVSMTFRHPYSGKNCTIKRLQLPLVPAFCITAHKSQGQTLERVIVDLEDCRGTEAPYVMLSRVKSLEGLHILRPFRYGRITVHPSQESRVEFQRLEILRLQTLQKYGSESEKQDATRALNGAQLSFPDLEALDVVDSNPACKRLLADAQQTVLEQTAILDNGERPSAVTRKRLRPNSPSSSRCVRQRVG